MSGDSGAADRMAKRVTEAKRFALSAAEYRKVAGEESQNAALALELGKGDEYERRQAAAKSARDVAEEMERRAYILEHGKEDEYRALMLKKYGNNNPELNKIAAYYAEKFNDQATLNWLKLQHSYIRSQKDDLNFIEAIKMMLVGGLFEDFEGASQEGAGSVPEKTAFDQASGAPNPDDNQVGNMVRINPRNDGRTKCSSEGGQKIKSRVRFKTENRIPPKTM